MKNLFEIKENLKHQYCDDIYFDFFEGNFLNPEKYLKNQEDIKQINDAREIIKKYFDTLKENHLAES